uniref:Uncharacterized protein n=1 Tax=Oncorhynchus mykiss TaxID=8022 RepID=A0A8C7NS11_ONCMY
MSKDSQMRALVECGWKDQLKAHCKGISEKGGGVSCCDLYITQSPVVFFLMALRIKTFLAQHSTL